MSWSVAQVSAGWAAIPNAFHPLWVWGLSTWLASWLVCGSRELLLWSQKSGDITIVTACGDIVLVVFWGLYSFILWCVCLAFVVVQRHSRYEAEMWQHSRWIRIGRLNTVCMPVWVEGSRPTTRVSILHVHQCGPLPPLSNFSATHSRRLCQ